MKKKFTLPEPIAREARKFKTLNEEHVVVLLAFTSSGAVLFKKNEGRSAFIVSKGVLNELETITPRASISIAKFDGVNNFAIVITAPHKDALIIRPNDSNHGVIPRGAILVYGLPGLGEIHVRNIFIRSSSCTCDSFNIDKKTDSWILLSIVEPLLLTWGFQFKWDWIFNSIFNSPLTPTCELEEYDEA